MFYHLISFWIFLFFSQNNFIEKEFQQKQLSSHLENYHQLKKKGGWEYIKTGKILQLGMVDQRVKKIKLRLTITDELRRESNKMTDTFDVSLEKAIKTFQKNHSMPETGIIDAKTLRAMNVSVEKRIHQIEINMKRWEQFKTESEKPFLFVNIASGMLNMISNQTSVMEMRVIVGKPDRKTPELTAELNEIEFNPYWIVPPGILRKDILPKIKVNPSYIIDHDMEVFLGQQPINPFAISWDKIDEYACPYKIIQNPGPENPLGVVKFIFPNKHLVYMHDTPSKRLFNFFPRTFSSGCVRLSKAVDLSKYILKIDKNWTNNKIDSLIWSEKTTRIRLQNPIKIYFSYFTAWVNKEGILQFAPDIYQKDN